MTIHIRRITVAIIIGVCIGSIHGETVKPDKQVIFRIGELLSEGRSSLTSGVYHRDRRRMEELKRKGLDRLTGQEKKDFDTAERTVKNHLETARKKYNEAIKVTLEGFNISPRRMSGIVADGREIRWKPQYSEQPPGKGESDSLCSVGPHGDVLLRQGAFNSPGMLAFCLDHERIHFDLFLTPGLDDRNTMAIEARILKQQLPLLLDLYGVTDPDWREIFVQTAGFQMLSLIWDASFDAGHAYERGNDKAFPSEFSYNPAWVQPIKNGVISSGELKQIDLSGELEPLASLEKKYSTFGSLFYEHVELVADVSQKLKEVGEKGLVEKKALTEAEEKKRWAERSKLFNERMRAKDAAWAALKEAAGLACSSPDKLESMDRNGETKDLAVDTMDLFFRLNVSQLTADRVNKCQQELLERIYNAKEPVYYSQLIAWGRDYRAAHPTVVTQIGRAVAEIVLGFFKALEDFSKALEARQRSSDRNNIGYPWPEGKDLQRADSETLRKLRGIKTKTKDFDGKIP